MAGQDALYTRILHLLKDIFSLDAYRLETIFWKLLDVSFQTLNQRLNAYAANVLPPGLTKIIKHEIETKVKAIKLH